MQAPVIPANEAERLASLQNMLLLDTPDEEAFDRITRIAFHLFEVPIALVSLIDVNRQWFKSCIGLPVRETGRDISFCGHAILGDELFIISDATQDARFADNPLVSGEPHIRFYAGKPLRNAEGFNIGTLCIIDSQPRQLTETQKQMFSDLGSWAETVLRLRQLSATQTTLLQQLDSAQRKQQIDPVLQVWNEQSMRQLLQAELAQQHQSAQPLVMATLSVDQYPQLQQQFGQEFASQALKTVSTRLRSNITDKDILGRYRDNELLILLPGYPESLIQQCGESLRHCIETTDPIDAPNGDSVALSVSIGIVAVRPQTTPITLADLLSITEQAHYQAKRGGGNQVSCSQF